MKFRYTLLLGIQAGRQGRGGRDQTDRIENEIGSTTKSLTLREHFIGLMIWD